jgi:predicted permease
MAPDFFTKGLPMTEWRVVAMKIASMVLIILAGWLARRKGLLGMDSTAALGRVVVDIVFPAMVFVRLLETIRFETLAMDWQIPVIAMGVLLVSYFLGQIFWPWLGRGSDRASFVFLAGMPNWIFIPLPIIESLYGAAGVRYVLLFNFGTQVLLWTGGVWILRPRREGGNDWRYLLKNPGFWATVAGVGAALLCPGLQQWEHPAADASGAFLGLASVLQGMAMLGWVTIPLSLLVTGAQLGALPLSRHRPTRSLWGVVGIRLVVAPLVAIGVVNGLDLLGWTLSPVDRYSTYIIMGMPVAVSCSLFMERYGGDSGLGALSIFYSTVLSLVTVPAWVYVMMRWHL